MSTAAPKVLYVQYTDPAAYPPLEHSAHILANHGWDVLALGLYDREHPFALAPHPRIRVRLMRRMRNRLAVRVQYFTYVLWVLAVAWRWKPAFVYASDTSATWVALLAARWCGVRVMYHEHDAPNPHPASRHGRMLLDARRALARRADLCIVPSTRRAQAFVEATGAPHVVVVNNCPAREEVGAPRGAVQTPVTVLYHGSIVPARVPLTVIDALAAQLRPVKLVIAGYETLGHRGYVEALMGRARTLGIADRVEYLGVIPARRDLLQVCARCDIGLALMPLDSADTSEQSMAGASNKAFDYLAHGLALIVSDLADWREMFVDAQFAHACDPRDVRSLAAALRALLDNPSEMRAMGERGRRRVASEWFYEHAFAPVLDRMTKTVAAGTVATPAAAARTA